VRTVPGTEPLWEQEAPLRELALHADWDSTASMIASLRIHLFEHGTIPTWNFLFCGGRPELSIPFSWAYTWPGAFAYLFEPNPAIVAVWMTMTLVGFTSAALLFHRWTGERFGALVGAGLYVCAGVFATAFYRGHVTWAFYHLIPALMLLFEVCWKRELSGARRVGLLAIVTVVSFLFFSGGLPHGLLYFYPALVALVAVRVLEAASARGWVTAARALGVPLAAHLLGLWMALYKLLPVVLWQIASPREGVGAERFGLGTVLADTVTWNVEAPFTAISYLGPVAWLVGCCSLLAAARDRWRRSSGGALPFGAMAAYGGLLVACGIVLSLGNVGPYRPGSWFAQLPVLNGVRGFMRYQILTTFGLSVLVAYGIARLGAWKQGRLWPAIAGLSGAGVLLPAALHAALLVTSVPSQPLAELTAAYPKAKATGAPEMLMMRVRPWYGIARPPRPDHAVAALEQGHWIANCRSDLTLPHQYVTRPPRGNLPESSWTLSRPLARIPLSTPPPRRLVELSSNEIVLEYDETLRGPVHLKLPVLETFELNVPSMAVDSAHRAFRSEDLPDSRLIVSARYPGPRIGALASAAGVLAWAGFLAALWGLSARPAPSSAKRS